MRTDYSDRKRCEGLFSGRQPLLLFFLLLILIFAFFCCLLCYLGGTGLVSLVLPHRTAHNDLLHADGARQETARNEAHIAIQ